MRRLALLTAGALVGAGTVAGCGGSSEPAGAAVAPAAAVTTAPAGDGGCTRAESVTSARSGQILAGPFLGDQVDAVRYGQAKLWVAVDPPPPGNPGATVRMEPLDPPGPASVQVRRQLGFAGELGENPFYPGAVPVRQHGLYKITVAYAGHTGCFLTVY